MTAKLWRHCKVVCRRLLIFDRFDRRKEKASHRRFSNLCCRRVLGFGELHVIPRTRLKESGLTCLSLLSAMICNESLRH
jgi:hypothetical protein